MSEFDKLLEQVAREVYRSEYEELEPEGKTYKGFEAVLKRRLLGLLDAGEKCRLVCTNREVAYEYDKQKQAAMEGR